MRREDIATIAVKKWLDTGQSATIKTQTGGWRVEIGTNRYGGAVLDVNHHSTLMARILLDAEGKFIDNDPYLHIGWGSLTDQRGMNEVFKALGMPYRYSRNGGDPRIEMVRGGQVVARAA